MIDIFYCYFLLFCSFLFMSSFLYFSINAIITITNRITANGIVKLFTGILVIAYMLNRKASDITIEPIVSNIIFPILNFLYLITKQIIINAIEIIDGAIYGLIKSHNFICALFVIFKVKKLE